MMVPFMLLLHDAQERGQAASLTEDLEQAISAHKVEGFLKVNEGNV